MNRRDFFAGTLGAVGTSLATGSPGALVAGGAARRQTAKRAFKMKYAPHFGMFRHHAPDMIDQIKFMADQGFRALEDNGMKRRKPELQDKIRAEMDKHDMEMGVFVATMSFRGQPTFASDKKDVREAILKDMRESVELAKRVRAKWVTVVPGRYDQGLEWDYQTANAIDNLKRAAEICEETGLVMVLEPLNPWRNHPGLFLTKMPQAYLICRAVGSPSCKILCDIYHQQITEGNLIPNIDKTWDEIAYIQTGDNPGRKEPTTGEINYRNIFRHLHAKGFDGILGMEHGNSKKGKEGEQAVIDAYRACDDF